MLWKNAEKLTERQQTTLARIQQLNQRLYRTYLLAQQLRQIYRVPAEQARTLLDAWPKWARRSRLEPFRRLARRITQQRTKAEAAFINNISNAVIEQNQGSPGVIVGEVTRIGVRVGVWV